MKGFNYVCRRRVGPFNFQIKFDGSKYPANPPVQPQLKLGTIVKGTVIIVDDTLENPVTELQ